MLGWSEGSLKWVQLLTALQIAVTACCGALTVRCDLLHAQLESSNILEHHSERLRHSKASIKTP